MKTTLIIQREKQTVKLFHCQTDREYFKLFSFLVLHKLQVVDWGYSIFSSISTYLSNLTWLWLQEKISWTLGIRFWYERFQILDNLLDTELIWEAARGQGVGKGPRPLDQSEDTWSSLDQSETSIRVTDQWGAWSPRWARWARPVWGWWWRVCRCSGPRPGTSSRIENHQSYSR